MVRPSHRFPWLQFTILNYKFRSLRDPLRVAQLVLPDAQDAPAVAAEDAADAAVAGLVAREFLSPERGVILRPRPMPPAPVPETPVHKHRHPLPRKDEVRRHPEPGTENLRFETL
jgi:hypothetical protein